MTAHDPRVTLTEAEREAVCICAEQVAVNLSAEESYIKAACDVHADMVADLIAARLAPIRALAEDWAFADGDTPPVPHRALADLLAALAAPVSASQDHAWHQPLTHCHCGRVSPCRHHDGAEGQGGGAGGCTPCDTCGGDQARGWHNHLVHNHAPMRVLTCDVRYVGDQPRGACLNDDGSPR